MGKFLSTPAYQMHSARDSKEAASEQLLVVREIWSALQARDIKKASEIMSSLGAYGAAIIGIGQYIEEIARIRQEEKVRALNIKALSSLKDNTPEEKSFLATLARYKLNLEKISGEVANSIAKATYYYGRAKQQEMRCSDLYDSLMSQYGSKPRTIDVVNEILKIELIRFNSNNNAIKAMNKEHRNLATQMERLSKLHQKIQEQFVSTQIINPVIKRETAKFLSVLDREISDVSLLMNEVSSSVKTLEKARRVAEHRAKLLGEHTININTTISFALSKFVKKIFASESRVRRANREVLVPKHKEIIDAHNKGLMHSSSRRQHHKQDHAR